jgi:serine/threonine protein kinase
MLEQGTLIDGRFEVDRLLGRGGMADVVRADDAATGEPVAIKLLRHPDVRNLTRFRTEIEALEVLDHPSVVRLRGSGDHGTRPYLVLDLVEGPTLAEVLLDGPTGCAAALAIAEQLASALAHAHELDVVHRDVKPSNVLFDGFDPEAPRPRLADFGLARFSGTTRVTATGTCVGTAAYLAPEQLEGRGGPPADVYSLGLVLIECLTGVLCYPGTVAESALARLHRSPAVPADLPPWLQRTLRAMTSRTAEARPSASAVATALHARSAAGMPGETTTTAPLRRPVHRGPDPRRSRRWALAAAGLTLVVGSGATVAAVTGGDLRVDEPEGRGADPTAAATPSATSPATTAAPPTSGAPTALAVEAAQARPAPVAAAPEHAPASSVPGPHGKGHGPKPRDDDKGPQGPKK